VHERGSQGWSGSTVAVGGAKALLDDEGAVVVVVAVAAGIAVVPPADVGVVVVGGGFTLKSVPVTTVTCEPGFIWVGSTAMITAPEIALATAWAAASSAGVFEE
jgi:hypothetical protein